RAPRLPGSRPERADQPQPVDRVDDARIRDHARGLVALQLADEVPGHRHAEGRALGSLRRGLLVAVLPDIARPELAQQLDVGDGIGLGHGDQRDLVAGATRGITRRSDPGADRVQAPGNLALAAIVRVTHRWHPGIDVPKGTKEAAQRYIDGRRGWGRSGCGGPGRPGCDRTAHA